MYIDSHCHINAQGLHERLPEIFKKMEENKVSHALCVCIELQVFQEVLDIAEAYPHVYASVGVHPDFENTQEPELEQLVTLSDHPRVVAIGETGLDYFRLQGDLEWQRERFRVHIRAARRTGKPLIIHTRSASEDTLRLMREEGAGIADGGPGGVMHCFTESMEVAEAAMEMGFFISFSGIVTFKNAKELQAVAKAIPMDRMLIETDSPYLAPVPFRGQTNEPGYVRHVGEFIAALRGISEEELARTTSENFLKLFKIAA